MSSVEDRPDEAPRLGPSTDVSLGDETVSLLIRGRAAEARQRHDQPRPRRTDSDTPDELGGTGGKPSGGAG